MRKGVYSMYGVKTKDRTNFYIVTQEENKLYQQNEIRNTISNTVGKGIYNQMHGCVKGMVHFISVGLGVRG